MTVSKFIPVKTTCRHCQAETEISLPERGGLFRCPSCKKLNFLIRRQNDDAIYFGEYKILEEVGQGANAVVCRAQQVKTGREVAIKLFYSETTVDSLSRREFLRENDFATQVLHPNIVRTYSGGEQDDVLYLILEYVKGVNLAQYLEYYGPMEPQEAMSLGCYAATALDFVWSNFLVIHRDIKPQNIMIAKDGNVKVCDFGMVTEHEVAVVDINAVEGTPYYLAPECVTDGTYQDNRSDIYSLGATLFHLIAGEPPFNYDSLEDVVYARIREEAPNIQLLRPEVDDGVRDVLRTMMAQDPEDRYVTAAECLQDMRRASHGKRPVLVDRSRPRTNV